MIHTTKEIKGTYSHYYLRLEISCHILYYNKCARSSPGVDHSLQTFFWLRYIVTWIHVTQPASREPPLSGTVWNATFESNLDIHMQVIIYCDQ